MIARRLDSPICSLCLAPTDALRGAFLLFVVDNNDRLYVRQLVSSDKQSTARPENCWWEVLLLLLAIQSSFL